MFISKKKHNEMINQFNKKRVDELKKHLKKEKESYINIQELRKENSDLRAENKKLKKENKDSEEIIFSEIIEIQDLKCENEQMETKIKILEAFIKFEYNKEIYRLEQIKKRTKKLRIKKKCESRILDYKSRLLAFN